MIAIIIRMVLVSPWKNLEGLEEDVRTVAVARIVDVLSRRLKSDPALGRLMLSQLVLSQLVLGQLVLGQPGPVSH